MHCCELSCSLPGKAQGRGRERVQGSGHWAKPWAPSLPPALGDAGHGWLGGCLQTVGSARRPASQSALWPPPPPWCLTRQSGTRGWRRREWRSASSCVQVKPPPGGGEQVPPDLSTMSDLCSLKTQPRQGKLGLSSELWRHLAVLQVPQVLCCVGGPHRCVSSHANGDGAHATLLFDRVPFGHTTKLGRVGKSQQSGQCLGNNIVSQRQAIETLEERAQKHASFFGRASTAGAN